jgi:polyribonucleotide nucleotidyltransferase
MALQLTPTIATASIDGSKTLTIEAGKIAKQADGSVVVRQGDTVVLVTVVSAKEKKEGLDFFPLTVEYQEKLYAAGKIPGSFFRREGRPTEKEVLSCRIIDRSLRPLFPDGYQNETQIIATVLSFDGENEPDVLALTGASAALALSDIPFHGFLAGVRVGRVDGKFVINPTYSQRALSDVDLVIGASEEAISMVEGGAQEVSEAVVVDALLFGHEQARLIIAAQKKLVEQLGRKPTRSWAAPKIDDAVRAKVREIGLPKVAEAYRIGEKHARYTALGNVKKEVVAAVIASDPSFAGKEKDAKVALEDLKYEYVRKMIVDEKIRIGGRKHAEIRDIAAEVGYLPRTHGSALFTRGETQALVVATLGTSDDEQRVESLLGQNFRKFMLHYNFPPYSVGETKRIATGRREVGHGALAERALKAMMPPDADFPYTIRIVSEILESNGSSSMATVCGGSLALMDAGVKIKAPVAGIAMGLIKEGEGIAILSDILGDEDHLGDMDFKVCGTSNGITALQMDIKITGVNREILEAALNQAKEGRLHILGRMAASLTAPREELNQFAPKITSIRISQGKIRDVIGPGGKVIKDITARTGCKIDINDDGIINIASSNQDAVNQAIAMIKGLTAEPEVGKVYLGTVRKIMEFGAFVEIFPGTDGLLHVSELSDKRVKLVTDVVNEGDEVLVKVLSVDKTGKIRLSRKEALAAPGNGAAQGTPPAAQ